MKQEILVSQSVKKLLTRVDKLKQEAELALTTALDKAKADLLKQQERHELILLQSRGLSGYNLVSDDYHIGTMHVVMHAHAPL